jgi:DNA-binding winged helix-turn-helix (wHTH) protein
MRLRKIFEPDPSNPRYFLTVRDAGYQFNAPQTSPSASNS